MRFGIALALCLLFLSGCVTLGGVIRVDTEGLPRDEVAVLHVQGDESHYGKVIVHSVDGKELNTGVTTFSDYQIYLKEGLRSMVVSYSYRSRVGNIVESAQSGKVALSRTFQKGRQYYLGAKRILSNKIEFYFLAYAGTAAYEKDVRPLPAFPGDFWQNYDVKTEMDVYPPDAPITVLFKNLPGNKRDWITIVPADASLETHGYSKQTEGKKDGKLMYLGQQAGVYEVRVYYDWPKGGYELKHRYRFTVR